MDKMLKVGDRVIQNGKYPDLNGLLTGKVFIVSDGPKKLLGTSLVWLEGEIGAFPEDAFWPAPEGMDENLAYCDLFFNESNWYIGRLHESDAAREVALKMAKKYSRDVRIHFVRNGLEEKRYVYTPQGNHFLLKNDE